MSILIMAVAGDEALAQGQPFAFAGSAVIIARAGADCDAVNAQVNEMHTSIFRPVESGVGTASLQLLQHQSAFRMQPTIGGDFAASGGYTARMFTGRGDEPQYAGNYSAFKIKPNPPTGTTRFSTSREGSQTSKMAAIVR